jgi:alpha-D-xyloside xylohydrolase
MTEAHQKGTPVIRPLFYDFPSDPAAWEIEDEYMFGPDILVAPVMYANMRKRMVYLPQGTTWIEKERGNVFQGGNRIEIHAPLDYIPIFESQQ